MTATNPNDRDTDSVDLNETEQLAALRAVTGGNAAGVTALAERLNGLFDLLELELEDAPGAELYLNDAKAAVAQIAHLAARLTGAAAAPDDALEPIDLLKLIIGVDERLHRIGRPGYQLGASSAVSTVVHGDLFLLQQTFLELPTLFPTDQPISVEFTTADLPGGAALAMVFGAPAHAVLKDAVHLFEKPAAAANRESLAELAGLAAVHGGRALARRSGDAPAYAVLFPQPAAEAAGYDRNRDDSAIRGTETVLLVDDENMIWDVVIDMLQSLGYTVLLAGNGRECVEIYRENPGAIDVVLLDMIMPEMNGREAFHALKEIDPKVRVLLQSGYVAEDDARDVLDSGACGFLRKPYRMVDLAARIREMLK